MKKFLSIQHKSLNELGVATYKELWQKAEAEGYQGLAISAQSTFTKAEDGEQKNKFHAVFSSDSEDRHGDVVHQDFDLKAFKKNPVFLDSHNYGSIERIIGRVNKLSTKSGKLEGDIEFAMENPLGTLAASLADGGFLNTTSIGFIPREFNDKGEILKSELLEISAVSVPANADALFEKEMGPEQAAADEDVNDPATFVDDTQPDVNEPVEPAPASKSINRKAVAARVVSNMVQERSKHLKAIAKAVHELNHEHRSNKKRKVYQTIRKLLAKDGQ